MNELRGFLIKTNGECTEARIDREHELEELYRVCECNTIDIVSRKIAGDYYDITCDDEALLKTEPVFTAVSKDNYLMLCGNLFITRNNAAGELADLTDDDVLRIQHSLLTMPDDRPLGLAKRLLLCEF